MGYNAVQLMAVAEHAHYGSILSYSRNIDFGSQCRIFFGDSHDVSRLLRLSCHLFLCTCQPLGNTRGSGDLHPKSIEGLVEKNRSFLGKELKYLIDTAHGLGIQARFCLIWT